MQPWHDAGDVRLFLGNCLDVLPQLPQVDAIVTSPPYADQRDYHAENGAPRKATARERSEAPMLFAESFEPFLDAMLDVLSPTGSLMLNLGIIMRDGEESPYADEILRSARARGWKLLHRMIWHKPNAIPLSHPTYLHIKHEWVFWLAPSTAAYRGFDRDTRSPHAESSVRRIEQQYAHREDARYVRRGKVHGLHPDGARPATVYSAAVGGERVDHPAIMCLKLARHLVSLSCPPGGVVLDPFSGSGTTALAARDRGRRAIGVEMNESYLRVARERMNQPRQLVIE
jgi:DNA modification methylase